MYKSLLVAVSGGLLAASTGCSTLIKQGYYTATGAQGSFYEIKTVNPQQLAEYRSFTVEPFTNSLGPVVPDKVVSRVNMNTPAEIAGAPIFYPEGKQLKVVGTIIHYTGRSGLTGSVSQLIGDNEECICRVQLLDAETGDLIGEAICWGTVGSAVRRGAEEIGKGVGKGVANWISKRLPEAEKSKRKADLQPKDG